MIWKVWLSSMKRSNYINWDEYFMGIAILSGERSKDPSTQVGACIVSTDNKILSIGYNGAPTGFDDDEDMPWQRVGNPLETKYLYVCHSELNAILNTKNDLRNARLYVTLFPCNECAKAIIQTGIKEIIYLDDKYADTESNIASRRMFDTCGVKYRKYDSSGKKLEINL